MVVYALEHPRAKSLAYRVLALAAYRHWGLSQLPEIQRGRYGKPFFSGRRDLQFNISHSGSYIFCALDQQPVGIDVQKIRPCRTTFLDRICSLEERDWMRRREDAPEAFAQLWSLKESRCKQSGRGLHLPISNISVPLPEQGEEHLELEGLQFYLHSGSSWKMCLCGMGDWDGTVVWLSESIQKEFGI